MMYAREKIPKKIVDKYQSTICFMVDTNQCLIEVGERRIVWIIPMGYEVEEKIIDFYAQNILRQLIDPSKEIFGTYVEKDLKLHYEFKKPTIVNKVRK